MKTKSKRITAKRGAVRFSREDNQPRFHICTNLGELLKTLKKRKNSHSESVK